MPTGALKFPLRTDSGMSKDTCGSRKTLDFLEGRTCQATLLDWEPTLLMPEHKGETSADERTREHAKRLARGVGYKKQLTNCPTPPYRTLLGYATCSRVHTPSSSPPRHQDHAHSAVGDPNGTFRCRPGLGASSAPLGRRRPLDVCGPGSAERGL